MRDLYNICTFPKPFENQEYDFEGESTFVGNFQAPIGFCQL